MDESTNELNRPRWDFIQFAVTFVGFLCGVTGMIINSIPTALTGLILMAIGLAYFLFRRSDLD